MTDIQPPAAAGQQRSRGFTLIELLITLVVAGILAAMAYPAYQQHVLKSQRSAAQTLLLEIYARQEHHFANAKRYATDLSLLGYPAESFFIDAHGRTSAAQNPGSTFKISLNGAAPYSFELMAGAVGRQTLDRACQSFALGHTGHRDASDEGCW